MYVPRAMYSFRTSFWIVPERLARGRAALGLGDGDVEAQQHRRRGVDGHRRRDVVERQAVEQHVHVVERRDRDARAPDLSARERVVAVAPHLGRQVEGDGQPRLARAEQELVASVRFGRRAEPGVLAHRPGTPAVHRRVDAARVRRLARAAEIALRLERRGAFGERRGVVDDVERDVGARRARVLGLGPVWLVSHQSATRSPDVISGTVGPCISVGSVFSWISSTLTPGARSTRTRPFGPTSITARSVDDPVHGSAYRP